MQIIINTIFILINLTCTIIVCYLHKKYDIPFYYVLIQLTLLLIQILNIIY